ncbi:hypothetical protein FB565_008332 [Actinoplanes lutulentus]|uniref:caspase, EACC1-associated type n=1 Tax=Actinoplanes lutulentus TaxID=1287878 RepID=UPI0015EC35DE|nr:ATP-binding protein [Actinoplanes lutulentus]MBB2948549.1 hypothetical protein [Actinoplanes lutulentus]
MYRALLVCNSLYEADTAAFHELHGPRTDGLALRDVLRDPAVGLFDEVELLSEHPRFESARAVNRFFSEAGEDDVLLFYFSGHGLTRNDTFFMCSRDTDTKLLLSTAISGQELGSYVGESPARQKILIFDCCHSGAFKSSKAALIAAELGGSGRFVITATPASGLARDAERAGQPSPFTRALIDGLVSGAVDENRDGFVDLDDLYKHLDGARPGGTAPQRRFDGSGLVRIARRVAAGREPAPSPTTVRLDELPDDLPFLDVPTAATSWSTERINEFRANLRDDIVRAMPRALTAAEFLQRANLLRSGRLTRAGALLFGESPSAVLPAAIVQCTRFHGATKGVAVDKEDLHGSIPEQIVRAVEFVGALSRRGEAPTQDSPIARPVYRYPMIAVREIIANAVVHRDYEHGETCVHVRVFDDRVEVSSPGSWTAQTITAGESLALEQLEGDSHRRNFRLASLLTWMRLVEGEGSGIPRAINDCRAVGAPEPAVSQRAGVVTVTIHPRNDAPDLATLDLMSVEEAAFALERMQPDEAVERLAGMAPEYAARRIRRMSWKSVATLLRRMDPEDAERILQAIDPADSNSRLTDLLDEVRIAVQERTRAGDVPPPAAEGHGRIVIQIEPSVLNDRSHIVSSWNEWGKSGLMRGEDRRVMFDDLHRVTREIIDFAEARFADRDGPLTVEFVLPFQLLNAPVERWARQGGADYPVLVRSLDRMRNMSWHRVWRRRWRTLADTPETAEAYFVQDGIDPARLENILQKKSTVTALILDKTPGAGGDEQLGAGLRSGVPVIIWSRNGMHYRIRDMVSQLISNGRIADLPERIRDLQLRAFLTEPGDPDHTADGLVLLWDDPNHQVP